jgi:hypothetical protein
MLRDAGPVMRVVGSRPQGLVLVALVVDPEHADDRRFEGEGLEAGL